MALLDRWWHLLEGSRGHSVGAGEEPSHIVGGTESRAYPRIRNSTTTSSELTILSPTNKCAFSTLSLSRARRRFLSHSQSVCLCLEGDERRENRKLIDDDVIIIIN